MNNEPVAYFAKDKQGWWAETDKETGIPFYTHPVKELTIHEDIVYGLAYKYGIEKGDVLDFSRAVLRKASEK